MVLLCCKLLLILAVVAAMFLSFNINRDKGIVMRSPWLRVLRRGTVGSNLTGACMFVSHDRCVFLVRGFCVRLITLPEETYRVCCVCV